VRRGEARRMVPGVVPVSHSEVRRSGERNLGRAPTAWLRARRQSGRPVTRPRVAT
jgi:hypothetical protein